ncbi:MAG: hypothetical protein COA88_11580 [Kordia sp.]|nr:MAG: hypothetical protein COA88_11580 [Kordia sp.]
MKIQIVEEYPVEGNTVSRLVDSLGHTITGKENSLGQTRSTLIKSDFDLYTPDNEHHIKQTPPPLTDILFIKKVNKVYIRLLENDIIWLKGEGNYTRIITTTKQHIVRKYLGALLKSIPSSYFVRIHKSYVVNMRAVEEIHPTSVLINGQKLPLAKSYYKSMMSKVNCYY